MPTQLSYIDIIISTAGGTTLLPVDEDADYYNITTTGSTSLTLLNNMTVSPTGTPVEGQRFTFYYGGQVTIAGFSLDIFGISLSASEALAPYQIEATYVNSFWEVKLMYAKSIGGVPSLDGADLILLK